MKFVVEEGGFAPVREHETDAGVDLRTPERLVIYPHSSVFVDLKVRVEIPDGCVGLMTSKSGLMSKRGIKTTGTIDVGYSGTIGCKVFNHSSEIVILDEGDKVTQLVVMPCIMDDVEIVDSIRSGERGENGFGSTGTGGGKKVLALNSGIDELELSVKTYNSLRRGGIHTIRDLRSWFYAGAQRRKIREVGEKTIKEIKRKIEEFDYETN